MLKQRGSMVRAVVIAVAGLSFGLIGTVGESAAQRDAPKDAPKKDETMMKADDKAMMNKGQKSDGMKKEEMQKDDKMKDDTMKDDKMMKKEK